MEKTMLRASMAEANQSGSQVVGYSLVTRYVQIEHVAMGIQPGFVAHVHVLHYSAERESSWKYLFEPAFPKSS